MKPYLYPGGTRIGRDNVVLHASSKRHVVDDLAGPLSIKTVIRGEVAWRVQGRDLVLDETGFLVLSEGERYSMNIDETTPVETCCVFFRPGFVEAMALDATSPVEAALEQPDREAPALPFLSRLHTGSSDLRERVQSLARRCEPELNPSGFEQDFLLAGERLLLLYEEIRERVARTPAVRAATRAELFRRLERGREYLHSRQDGPVSLGEVAREACLSPYHFQRTFREVNGCTPHEYLTELRLGRARRLLEAGDTVLDACLAAGFSSPESFSRLFRKRMGLAPSAVRRRAKFARSDRSSGGRSGENVS